MVCVIVHFIRFISCVVCFQGIKLSRDGAGNIYGTRLTDTDIICKGYKNPENWCYSEEIVENLGRMQKKAMKVQYVMHDTHVCNRDWPSIALQCRIVA